ncbi:MAG: phosphoribosyl-AMP cyclohydrolase [Cellvibrionales bacterium TMED148]|nr:phosphoribosyl-AMP cyclohydrolase [Porticoccaceae bacterium]RPG89327.1 MAG: phosphoribosyl-AMP cyclohydrolase [Cellvibrionales bacterium TMED148]|tara:strand:- start:81 stop:461 length:381 start_codon:yes stop_codon:yes gene_type:complete
MTYADQVLWNKDGLVPAITQDALSGRVLVLAWMNREALETTVAEQRAVYWSRSRNKLWRKGEESGNILRLIEVQIDCDSDAILLKVEAVNGIACHTGRESCFFKTLHDDNWEIVESTVKKPKVIGP